jgi:hypothetical protein
LTVWSTFARANDVCQARRVVQGFSLSLKRLSFEKRFDLRAGRGGPDSSRA